MDNAAIGSSNLDDDASTGSSNLDDDASTGSSNLDDDATTRTSRLGRRGTRILLVTATVVALSVILGVVLGRKGGGDISGAGDGDNPPEVFGRSSDSTSPTAMPSTAATEPIVDCLSDTKEFLLEYSNRNYDDGQRRRRRRLQKRDQQRLLSEFSTWFIEDVCTGERIATCMPCPSSSSRTSSSSSLSPLAVHHQRDHMNGRYLQNDEVIPDTPPILKKSSRCIPSDRAYLFVVESADSAEECCRFDAAEYIVTFDDAVVAFAGEHGNSIGTSSLDLKVLFGQSDDVACASTSPSDAQSATPSAFPSVSAIPSAVASMNSTSMNPSVAITNNPSAVSSEVPSISTSNSTSTPSSSLSSSPPSSRTSSPSISPTTMNSTTIPPNTTSPTMSPTTMNSTTIPPNTTSPTMSPTTMNSTTIPPNTTSPTMSPTTTNSTTVPPNDTTSPTVSPTTTNSTTVPPNDTTSPTVSPTKQNFFFEEDETNNDGGDSIVEIPEAELPPNTPTFRPTCVNDQDFNLCIAVDMSGSICSSSKEALSFESGCIGCPSDTCRDDFVTEGTCCNNFAFIKGFASLMIRSLSRFPADKTFSIVQFATEGRLVSMMESHVEALSTIDELYYTGGITNHAEAISLCRQSLSASLAYQHFASSASSSSSSHKSIMMLITDGVPTTPENDPEGTAMSEAIKARDEYGVFIIPVFISPRYDADAMFFMRGLSNDDKVFDVVDYASLDTLKDSLLEEVSCST